MKLQLLFVIGSVATAAPLAAALRGRARSAPRRWVLVWTGVQVLESGLQGLLSILGVHNLWLVYVLAPVDCGALLWALSLWQIDDVARVAFRLAIAASGVAFYVLAAAFDRASTFSLAALPMVQLVSLAAAAYTLVARSRVTRGDPLQEDWFWVCAGMALLFGVDAMLGPLSRLLLVSDPGLFRRAYQVNAVLTSVAFLAIARGIACPIAT